MMMIGRGPNMEAGAVRMGPQYQTCGELPVVMTGSGSTVAKARKSVYSAVDEVCFSNSIYRTDVGEKVMKALPDLHKRGWATETEAGDDEN